ncbi:hypothetical protein T492DRAFT_840125 [Pavlovales sp. CCMP2436]|nr:hypothetical protein T492DRAFT_840125 [Pavlovales sp. CCMP2436]
MALAQRKVLWAAARELGHKALDAGLVPDVLTRLAIRKFCAQKIAELDAQAPGVEAQMARLQDFAASLRTMPIAVHNNLTTSLFFFFFFLLLLGACAGFRRIVADHADRRAHGSGERAALRGHG